MIYLDTLIKLIILHVLVNFWATKMLTNGEVHTYRLFWDRVVLARSAGKKLQCKFTLCAKCFRKKLYFLGKILKDIHKVILQALSGSVLEMWMGKYELSFPF